MPKLQPLPLRTRIPPSQLKSWLNKSMIWNWDRKFDNILITSKCLMRYLNDCVWGEDRLIWEPPVGETVIIPKSSISTSPRTTKRLIRLVTSMLCTVFDDDVATWNPFNGLCDTIPLAVLTGPGLILTTTLLRLANCSIASIDTSTRPRSSPSSRTTLLNPCSPCWLYVWWKGDEPLDSNTNLRQRHSPWAFSEPHSLSWLSYCSVLSHQSIEHSRRIHLLVWSGL